MTPIYSHRDVVKIALLVAPLWFGANFMYNYSLLLTSVGSSTIIRFDDSSPLCQFPDSNLSGSFTLLFSYIMGVEQITPGKILGLVITLGGVSLVSNSIFNSHGSPDWHSRS